MTEQEWLACTEPAPMLEFLRPRSNARKARLFGCGFLRLIWSQLDGKEGSRQAVAVSERFADGEATRNELRQASRIAEATAEAWSDPALEEPVWQAVDTTSDNAWAFFERVHYETTEAFPEPDIASPRTLKLVKERRAARHALYVHLLRDLFGNPFRPAALEPAWRTPMTLAIGQSIYDERRFQDLPVLADALEEAGCNNPDILAHCRGPGPHVRGCWLIDLLTGRE
jgi:hypothetical protein